jgi:hypothetical protein
MEPSCPTVIYFGIPSSSPAAIAEKPFAPLIPLLCQLCPSTGVASARVRKPKNLENFGSQGISGDLE